MELISKEVNRTHRFEIEVEDTCYHVTINDDYDSYFVKEIEIRDEDNEDVTDELDDELAKKLIEFAKQNMD